MGCDLFSRGSSLDDGSVARAQAMLIGGVLEKALAARRVEDELREWEERRGEAYRMLVAAWLREWAMARTLEEQDTASRRWALFPGGTT